MIRINIYSLNVLPVIQKVLDNDDKIDVTSLAKVVYLISL
jgi:hypothetical protein